MSIKRHPTFWGVVLVLLVTAIAVSLTLQGWRSRVPAFDMLTFFNSAHHLLTEGTLPRYGDVSSYGSFSPPGTAWLMALGMAVFRDPQLFESVGGAFLYLGTLLGLFSLARAIFGNWCAYLTVLLYGLSEVGLNFALSLWPIGHPFFYVWVVFMAHRWAYLGDARYLAAAGVMWATGMYVDMAIAPIIFVFPVLWLFYRPPLRLKPLLVGAAVAVAIWFPYLHFEAGRGFADLRSQLFLQPIFPANYRDAWCSPSLSLVKWEDGFSASSLSATVLQSRKDELPDPLRPFASQANAIGEKLLSNFVPGAPFPGINIMLLLPVMISLVVLSVSRPITSKATIGLSKKAKLLALSLSTPWLILVLVAEPGKPERFLWLWPLQVVFLSAFFTHVLPTLGVHRAVSWIGQMVLVLILVGNPFILSRIDSWLQIGWDGADSEEVRMVDYIAGQVRAEGRDRAAIGYHTIIYPFMAEYNHIDPQYKVGAEFDLLFRYRTGISNANFCAEGISSDDEYRIVQIEPQKEEYAPRHYFDIQRDDSFHLLRQFGPYQLFKRGVKSEVVQ